MLCPANADRILCPLIPAPQVGAVSGIGVVEAVSGRRPEGATGKARFNWLLLAKFFLGWVATLVVAAGTSAAFTAQVGRGGWRKPAVG